VGKPRICSFFLHRQPDLVEDLAREVAVLRDPHTAEAGAKSALSAQQHRERVELTELAVPR